MTISARCMICSNSDMRRLIELGWNAKMSCPDLTHAFGGVPSASVILKHLHEHVEDGAWSRTIPVEDARPMRTRVLDIQRAQVEAIERQMAIAEQEAYEWNEDHRGHVKDGPCSQCAYDGFRVRDPSHYFNILGKDMQAAVASILKSEGLTLKRETSKDATRVDMFRLMIGERGGLAPAGLIEDGNTVPGDFKEVTPDVDSLPE